MRANSELSINCAPLIFSTYIVLQRNVFHFSSVGKSIVLKICNVLEINVIIAKIGTNRQDQKGLTIGGASITYFTLLNC